MQAGFGKCSLSVKPHRHIVERMLRTAALVIIGLLGCSPAFADTFRCGTKLIGEGDSRARRGRTNDTSYSRAKDLITKKIAVLTGLEK